MLKPIMPKFHSDLSVRLRDIAEKQVPVRLKPIVVTYLWHSPIRINLSIQLVKA